MVINDSYLGRLAYDAYHEAVPWLKTSADDEKPDFYNLDEEAQVGWIAAARKVLENAFTDRLLQDDDDALGTNAGPRDNAG